MARNARPSRWTVWRVLRVIVGGLLALFAGGYGLLLVVGFAVSPDVLARTADNGFPLWPLLLLLVLLSFAVACGGVMMILARRRAPAERVPDAAHRTEGPSPMRERRVAPPPTWTARAVIHVLIGIVLFGAGAFIALAAIGLIITSGWEYLFSEAPGLGDSNFTAILGFGTIGAMLIMGGFGLIAERHKPRAPKRTKPSGTAT